MGHHIQSIQAWHKEILATARFDKLWNARHHPRAFAAVWVSLNDEFAWHLVISQQRTGIVARIEIHAEIDPLLLHEFELALDIGAHSDEDHTAFCAVIVIRKVECPVR